MTPDGYKQTAARIGLTALLVPLAWSLPAHSQRHTTTLNTGTVIAVKLNDGLNSRDARKGDTFTTTVTNVDANDNSSALPVGTKVEGVVRSAEPKNDKQPGVIDLAFNRVTLPGGRSYAISGSPISLDSKSVTRRNGQLIAKPGNKGPNRLTYVGIGAGAGLLVNVLTHRKGTLLDTLIGGGLGYAAGSLIKNGSSARDVDLKVGTKMGVRLDRSVAIAR
jgi:hypothetical protein